MAHRSHVPKFGNWESGENVPYTVYFDKARKGRTGTKMINPNDPEENPDILSEDGAPSQFPPSPPRAGPETQDLKGQPPVRPVHERKVSREEGDLKPFAEFPAQNDNIVGRTSNGSKHQQQGGRGAGMGDYNRRATRGSAGSEYGIEKSPLHHQARASGRGSSSPSWEGSKNSRDNYHGTTARSRLGGASRGDEALDKGSTVPKFGEWDENNPASADGYTHIFNKVREERQSGPRTPGGYAESPYRAGAAKKTQNSDSMCCCFPWGRK